MSTVQSLFEQAQLAEAAYANFFDNSGNLITTDAQLISALTTGDSEFSTAQATAFAARYQVISQYTASGLGGLTDGSGFSATLFESLDNPGQYTLALRGTEGIVSDLLGTDLADIVADGIAIDQVIDLYNYWQSLSHTGIYQAAYLETSYTETATLAALALAATGPLNIIAQAAYTSYLAALRADGAILNNNLEVLYVRKGDSNFVLPASSPIYVGSGLLSSDAVVDVTGHSLGGHLAMAFSRLFPGNTADVVAVNGAGFDYTDPNVDALFAVLKGNPGFDAGKITNAVGTAGPYVTSQDWLFLQQPAGRTDIYTESGGLDTWGGHAAGQMTDSLALYNLFAQLDPTLNNDPDGFQTITDILKASSNVAENTLESAITDLGKLFGITGTTFTGNDFDVDRNKLYDALAKFNGIPNATILSLAGMDAADIEANALTDPTSNTGDGIAYRYALVNGNPFVALGLDYSEFNVQGELNVYNAATNNTGDLTEDYLADRAMMLQAMLQANTDDMTVRVFGTADVLGTTGGWSQQAGEDIYYQDITVEMDGVTKTTTTLYQGNNTTHIPLLGDVADASADDMWQFQFGSTQNDTLTGGNNYKENHLYGGAGDDSLTGGNSVNYLEGGKGNDTLEGGLYHDILYGGKGNDILHGGSGHDEYIYHTGDGYDTIYDSDYHGCIEIDGAILTGGAGGDYTTYTGTDTKGVSHTYTYLTGEILYYPVGEQPGYEHDEQGNHIGHTHEYDGLPYGHSAGDLQVDDKILIKNFSGALGIGLYSSWTAPNLTVQLADLTTYEKNNFSLQSAIWHLGTEYDDGTYLRVYEDSTSPGHYAYSNTGVSNPNYQPVFNDLGIPIYASAVRYGNLTCPSDHLIGSASDDWVGVEGGVDSRIETGKGHDYVASGWGDDIISGGADSDILAGYAGDDQLYADAQMSVTDAIATGNLLNTGNNIRGDWLAGVSEFDGGTNTTDCINGLAGDGRIRGAANDQFVRKAA